MESRKADGPAQETGRQPDQQAGQAPKPKAARSRMVVEEEHCKGCGYCVSYCPKHSLVMTDKVNKKGYHYPLVDEETCVHCGICELLCPEFSIYVSDLDAPGAPPRPAGKPAKRAHMSSPYLRMERMPHMWCPGCGIGTAVNCFALALTTYPVPVEKISIVSGIGCTGRVANYVRLDSFHTTHGRAIPFATGLALANPELKVVVFSGDGDISAIGGNHLIHAARRNVNLTVICVNNFTYGMTGGQVTPTTPLTAKASTAPFGAYEPPFNLPFLAESSGAVYVARWTVAHTRQATKSINEALKKKGFSFVELISPCPTFYSRLNHLGYGLETLKLFQQSSEIKNGADTRAVDIAFKGKIVVGKFVDKDSPTYLERMNEQLSAALGESYVPWGAAAAGGAPAPGGKP